MQAYIYHYLPSLTILVSTNPKYSLLPSPLSKSPSSTASCCVIKTSSKQWPNMMFFFFFLLPQFQVLNVILRKASIYLLCQQHIQKKTQQQYSKYPDSLSYRFKLHCISNSPISSTSRFNNSSFHRTFSFYHSTNQVNI